MANNEKEWSIRLFRFRIIIIRKYWPAGALRSIQFYIGK